MKKLSILLFLCCITMQAFSQGHLGVKAGGNIAKLQVEGENLNTIGGLNAGIVYYTNLENPLFIQSGIQFNQKGTKENSLFSNVSIVYNFIEVPVNIGYQVEITDMLKLAPFVGGYVGYALTGKAKAMGETINLYDKALIEELEYEEGFSLNPNRLDAGINIGAGLHINNKLILNGQYSHGLTEIFTDAKTRTLTFGLTFLF